jgi:multicomponent Na+:H+ antiporter subunit B
VSRRARLILFGLGGTAFAAVLLAAFTGLPSFGDAHEIYGRTIDAIAVKLRHATDVITAVNFDFRAFDTLGEEFILFASVLGVMLILRQLRGERVRTSHEEEHSFAGASDALRALGLLLVPTFIALGCYVIVHGQLTPGGGFQGGVVLGTGPLAVFLAGRYLRMRAITPQSLIELGEAIGAGGYALLGLSGLVVSGIFFQNPLPLGTSGKLLSGGQTDLANVLVGIEVSSAFLLAWSQFLDQAIVIEGQG